MKKAIVSILVWIFVAMLVWIYFLVKIDKDLSYFRDSYIRENYAAEKELFNELEEISAKLSVMWWHLVSNGF
jgi:hypothetical protein